MSMIQSDLLLGQEGGAGYTISRSLRFNSSDSAYLSRTMSSASSTYTLSMWVKRSTLASNYKYLFSSGNAGIAFYNGTDQFYIFDGGTVHATTGVYRDTSAWYHILLSVSSNTGAAYINSTQVLSGKNTASLSTTANATNIGRYYNSGSGDFYFDGYIADVYLIDGQALTPSSFGEFSATTGRWEPKKYSGPTPTGNSFWLPFSDNSAATATTLGKDGFLLGNNWTCNNITVDAAGFSTTIASSQVWSNYLSPSGSGWQDATRDATKAFDSDLTTFAYVNSASSSEYINFSFPSGISNHGGFIWLRGGNGNGQGLDNMTVTINGSTVSSTARTGTAWNNWFKFPVSGALTSFRITGVYPVLNAVSFWTDYSTIVVNSQAITYGAPAVKDGDSTVDTPTSSGVDTSAGGEVRGNYATFNPTESSTSGTKTLTNGNLDVLLADANAARLTIPPIQGSGKYQWEITIGSKTATYYQMGLNLLSMVYATGDLHATFRSDGNLSNTLSGSWSGTGVSYTSGDVITVTYDNATNACAFYKNGVYSATFTVSGTPQASLNFGVFYGGSGNTNYTLNAGQRPFAYPVSGFKALCDTNLPAPVVAKPSSAFDVKLYTGNGGTQTVSGLGFTPDFLWFKKRNNAATHIIIDTVRGTDANGYLFNNPDGTNAESVFDTTWHNSFGKVTALTGDGFTVVAGSNANGVVNQNNDTYVAWAFDAGTTTTTNTQGSITSQVRANASAGFSIVSWTGGGVDGSVGHGLGVAPKLYIYKNRSAATNWGACFTMIDGSLDFMYLNLTNAKGDATQTPPSSSVIYLQSSAGDVTAGNNYIAYCFAPVAGYSSFGSYTGNGSADGPFVFCNFRPRWILIKSTGTTNGWGVYDTARGTINVNGVILEPNSSNAENTYTQWQLDILSNGFKIRSGSFNETNGNGVTYVYAAFAESPFQYARAR